MLQPYIESVTTLSDNFFGYYIQIMNYLYVGLTVLVGPYSKVVEEGTSPEFYCSVDGNVIGSVKWSKEIGTSKVS